MDNTVLQPYERMIAVKHYQCLRCGEAWIPNSWDALPAHCAKCNSPYWTRPRTRPAKTDKEPEKVS